MLSSVEDWTKFVGAPSPLKKILSPAWIDRSRATLVFLRYEDNFKERRPTSVMGPLADNQGTMSTRNENFRVKGFPLCGINEVAVSADAI